MRIKDIFKRLFGSLINDIKIKRYISEGNDICINQLSKNHVKLNINGKNNKIYVKSASIRGRLNIDIYGDNNSVFIDNDVIITVGLSILIGQNHPNFGKVCNSKFEIQKNTSIESANYVTFNSNSFCNIEEDCMLAFGITIFNTDAHPIFDKDTKQVLNKVRGVQIGRHSWIGMNVTILKNSVVPNNSVIGFNSVFSGSKESKTYCAFAGNPAKIVRENVDWDSNGNKYRYIENEL